MSASKILVPIGFSKQSLIALGQACKLAKIKQSKVILLSVIEEQSMIESLFLDDKTDELKNKVQLKLENIAEEYQASYSIDIDVMVAKGRVYEQVNEVSQLISADLIVMGTNGASTRVKKFIGSNAERVVRLSRYPVITIKGEYHRDGCQNIVLPLDLEKETKEKVTYALEYARYWNATIRVVSVVLKNNSEAREKLTKNINQVKNFITNANVECTAELLEGDDKQTLGDFVFNYQKKVDADLIIIMNKKEELSFTNNISVTARYIINNSQVPVMSIRPKDKRHITRPTTAF